MPFKKKVQKANHSGSIKVIIPHDETGPNGEEIEEGDNVILDIVGVEKQGETSE